LRKGDVHLIKGVEGRNIQTAWGLRNGFRQFYFRTFCSEGEATNVHYASMTGKISTIQEIEAAVPLRK
jgi:hypothetical protein